MRHLLLAAVTLSLLLTLLVAGSIALGSQSPAPRVLRHAAPCPLPCWQGLNAGRTRIDPANQIMLNMGYSTQNSMQNRTRLSYPPASADHCAVLLEHREAIVTEIRLSDCPALLLGDVMAEIGAPDSIQPGALSFTFAAGRVKVKLEGDGCQPRITPFLPVRYISLTTDAPPSSEIAWQGFRPPRDYIAQLADVLMLAC